MKLRLRKNLSWWLVVLAACVPIFILFLFEEEESKEPEVCVQCLRVTTTWEELPDQPRMPLCLSCYDEATSI